MLFFLVLIFALRETKKTKSLQTEKIKRKNTFVSDQIRGEVTGNDSAEQSFNFSKRLGPLNLQVPVSFRRQWLNIVAVLIQKAGPCLRCPILMFLKRDKERMEAV